MKNIKFFICPSTKNVTDAVIRFCEENDTPIALIPTRRQVEWNGGYANNWTTEAFCNYAKKLPLERDHAGPSQGHKEDDGYVSLSHDCNYFDLIHIDPWKKYPEYEAGLRWTAEMIKFCHNLNPNVEYEVGTEEGIRPFEVTETELLIKDLRLILGERIFDKVKYVVVQSGALVKENQNLGHHDSKKLKQAITVAKENNLLTKEHNGDYLGPDLIKEKMDIGLDSINIGPEISLIETKTYLDAIENESSSIFKTFWELCYNSFRWKRWVDDGFDPLTNRRKVIEICGHYVLSDPSFVNKVKNNFPKIDEQIQINITSQLKSLYHGR
jgi:hypothetical protein